MSISENFSETIRQAVLIFKKIKIGRGEKRKFANNIYHICTRKVQALLLSICCMWKVIYQCFPLIFSAKA